MTPSIAFLQVQYPYGRSWRLWLPLFLLWIPVILLSPVFLLAILIAGVALRVSPWNAIRTMWGIAVGLRGTDVRVETQEMRVVVRLL